MRTVCALLLAVVATGCTYELPTEGVDGGATPRPVTRYAPTVDPQTIVAGYVWDPEAYWVSLALCGPACPIPPLVMPGIPHFEAAVVRRAEVKLFDPLSNSATLSASAPSGAQGSYSVMGVPSRGDVPFFPTAVTPDAPAATDGGAQPVTYLPTFTMRPVVTSWTQCLAISTVQASTIGILDAVAQAESQPGAPVAVADLVNPAKYGGVAVFWMYQPLGGSVRVPAFGTRMDANVGRVLLIDWAPPGVLPAAAKQSPRGFHVGAGPVSGFGISVVLLPPLAGPPAPVTFTPVDPVTDLPNGRPWKFPALPPTVIAPGMISFGELPGIPPGPAGAPPAWLCLPPG